MAAIGAGTIARSRTVHHKIRGMCTYARKMHQTPWAELYANSNRGLSLFDSCLLQRGAQSRVFTPQFVMLGEAVINSVQLHRQSHTDIEAALRASLFAGSSKIKALDRAGGHEWGFVSNSARGWERGRSRPSHHFPSSGREWMYCHDEWTGAKKLSEVFADLVCRVKKYTDDTAKKSFASTLVETSVADLVRCGEGHRHAYMVPAPLCAYCNCHERVHADSCMSDGTDGMHYHHSCYAKCVSAVSIRPRSRTVHPL